MGNPIVSVVISTYNRSSLLPHAIRSVLSQDFQDFELIVVDDGSTDDTCQTVASFDDPRIRYVHQTNSGLAAGRNSGIRESRGKYIAFLDDDDVFLPNKLTLQVSFMEAHTDLGWSAGGHLIADLEGRIMTQWRPWLNYPRLDTATWLFDCPTCPAAVMVARTWIERINGFDAVHDIIDDWDAWLRLAYAGCGMDWISEFLCEYRIHNTNMTRTQNLRGRVLRMLDRFFAQDNVPDHIMSLKSKVYAKIYLEASCREFAEGFIAEAQMDLSQAVQLAPDYLDNEGDHILQILCSAAERSPDCDSRATVERALQNLPPEVASLPRIKQRGRAKLAMLRFFKAAQQEDWSTMRRILPEALFNNPKLMLNRSVWSFGATAILGAPTVNRARALYRLVFN